MNKYRALKNNELPSLKGTWLIKRDNGTLFPVAGIGKINVQIGNMWYTGEGLLEHFTYEDDSAVGIEVELTADGYTREEFLELAKNDASNVEYKAVISKKWMRSHCDKKGLAKISSRTIYKLTDYRIKPTPKYICPIPGWTGILNVEVNDDKLRPDNWKKEILRYMSTRDTAFPYVVEDKDGLAEYYSYCRLKPFSAENPPPVGTRFVSSLDEAKYKRYGSLITGSNHRQFYDETGDIHYWKDINDWMDYEEV